MQKNTEAVRTAEPKIVFKTLNFIYSSYPPTFIAIFLLPRTRSKCVTLGQEHQLYTGTFENFPLHLFITRFGGASSQKNAKIGTRENIRLRGNAPRVVTQNISLDRFQSKWGRADRNAKKESFRPR
jgi:hypothetical protein